MKSYVVNIRRVVDQLVFVNADNKAEAMAFVTDITGDTPVSSDSKGVTGYGDLDPVDGRNTYRFVKD